MDNKIFLVTALVMLSAFAGAGMQNAFAFSPADADNAIKIVSLSTDKDVYHSNEEMEIVLSLYSPGNVSNVLVEVSGVKNRGGKDLISSSRKATLTPGENEMTFIKKLPSCSPCAGIGVGTYFINVSVAYGDEVVNATHSIAITPNPNQITHVNIVVEEAKRLIESEDITLLDVRTEAEYHTAHIEGATLIPVSELSNRTEELNKSKKIVVYCRSGHRSVTASGILIEQGFDRVYNVLGGINAWEESGYAVVSTATSTPEQPGFEAVLAIAGLLTVAYLIKRRKASFK
ncbi:MAG: PGF-CTERM sorting domain-containing protein [Candidatus Syntrophoarchaeum sp.]|nr:PGF-CTERM sorting domain-containing protein [Candidatus Syntrophoarchaeum sp.]